MILVWLPLDMTRIGLSRALIRLSHVPTPARRKHGGKSAMKGSDRAFAGDDTRARASGIATHDAAAATDRPPRRAVALLPELAAGCKTRVGPLVLMRRRRSSPRFRRGGGGA